MKKILTVIALLIITGLPTIAQTVNNPSVKNKDDNSTLIRKVETTDNYTVITFETKASSDNAWVQLNKEIYLQTNVSNAHYDYIKSENIAMAPAKYTFNNAGDKLIFRVYFKKIPSTAKYINIIERSGSNTGKVSYFNFYDVSLAPSNTYQYKLSTGTRAPQTFGLLNAIKIDTATGQLPTVTISPIRTSNNELTNAMNAIGPMMATMSKTIMDTQLEYYKQPGKLAEIAKLNKAYFDALVNEGFTRDEALKIITANSILPKPMDTNNK